MSYTLDAIGTPSYRRVIDSRTSYSRTSASPSSGFRSRTTPSTMSVSYKRATNVPVARAYGSAVLNSTDSLDFSQPSLLNGDFKRSNEKEQLQGLNDRFAGYIDKVHFLEQQNREIEAEIQALRQKQVSQSQLGDVYDQELRELRSTLEQIHRERTQIQLDADHIEEDIQRLTERYQDEARVREETEAAIRGMKKDADDSALIKVELDKKVQSLQDEVDFLRKNHEEEVNDLLAQMQTTQITAERKDYQKTDLTAALREIRSQLDGHSSKNLQQAEDWFMCRYSKLTEAAEQNKDAIKTARDEISEYRRQLQTKNIELESVRSTKESLERQLSDIEDRHNGDLASLQESIHQLDNELKSTKWEMARHLREYQDLLNVKMALDIEIAAYRKLLEGEETRFSSFSGGISSPSFPYRQTIGKVKTEAPKLKVQHKFVEEIIEETRVEDEKSDMDEALAEVVEELSAEREEEEEEKGGEEEEEEKEEAAEGEEEEQAEEEEVVASTQAAVSASPPAEEEEEKEDKDDDEEDKEGEGEAGEEAEEEGEGEGAEEKEEEGEEEQGEGEGGEEEGQEGDGEESGVEETVLSTKATKESAMPEKVEEAEKDKGTGEEEKTGDEEEVEQKSDDKEDAGSDKESKDAKEKEEDQGKADQGMEEEKSKEVKEKEPVAKSESPKAEAKKEEKKSDSEDKEEKKSESEEKEKKSDSEDKEEKKSDSEEKGEKKSDSEDKEKKSDSEDKEKKSDSEDKEDKKSDSEGEGEKESKAVHKEDMAINGEVEKGTSDDEEKHKVEKKEGDEKKEVVANGVSESPGKDDAGQKVVITETVETITMGEDGAKHVTTSVTVTETVEEESEMVHEQQVSTKKMEKVTSQTVKQVTETQ